MNHFLTSWKSTLQGLLTGLMTLPTLGVITSVLSPKEAAWITIIAFVSKQTLAGFQVDAGVVLATTPTNPVPHAVDSSEVPLDPTAVPVTSEPKP